MTGPWEEPGREAMERWQEVMGEMRQQQTPSTDKRANVLHRYLMEHRGKPDVIAQFAAQNVGPARAEAEARRYVEAMEKALRGGR